MLQRLSGKAAAALLLTLLPAAFLNSSAPAAAPPADSAGRVQTMFTSWDDYYFYAAFRVHDTNVLGTNTLTTSQPQQDDDVEVFFETDDGRAKVRTPQTFQMAVSAAQGAYFSVGDGTKTPKGKAVYSYKYAVTVNGTLNKPEDTDTGYDVEIAIPWTELGRSGPPAPGATWGFNVISRDRASLTDPAGTLYSLSAAVKGKGDVQNPSKWTKITFVNGNATSPSTLDKIVCAKVVGQFPRVNGTIVSGDWPATTRIGFGTDAVNAPAPALAEEPNTTQSPFDVLPQTGPAAPAAEQVETAAIPTGTIDLPNGHGVIKIVPGGIKNPAGMEVPVPVSGGPVRTRKVAKGEYKIAQVPPGSEASPGQYTPGGAEAPAPAGVVINSGAFVLGQPKPPAFVMGVYRLDFNADARLGTAQNVWNTAGGTLLADQPMNGAGPWFSGLRTQWHRQQLAEMRLAGIEVALLRTQPNDPLLGRELDAFVEALKEMKAQKLDYPLVGVDATTGQPDLNVIYAHVPAEFRAMEDVPGLGVPGIVVYDVSFGSDAAKTLADGTPVARVYHSDTVTSVSPGRADKNGVVSRKGGRTYDTSWQVALVSTPNQIVVDSWNDFAHGTEIAASRQYGEQYVDATRAQVVEYDGDRQWHAKYLTNAVPRTIFPKTLYQVPIRIENAGTLPWRTGEGYSLSMRWYKDGKLFDDSAPRIPINQDVNPGHTLTLSMGLVARNNSGEDLEPGDYDLVVDMVQGQDRWFSYAGDSPLQVPVTVIGASSAIGGTAATFLGTATPGIAQAGASVPTTVQVRNDGSGAWLATYTLNYKLQTTDPDGSNPKTVAEGHTPVGSDSVTPGQLAVISLPVPMTDAAGKPLGAGAYRLHWFIQPDGAEAAVNGNYDEALQVAEALPTAVLVAADLPPTADPGKTVTAHLALQNVSAHTLKKSAVHIGYHLYYLDGTEREWDGGPTTTLPQDLLPGISDSTITAPFQAPKQPGRYAVVWDVREGDGSWQSTLPVSGGEMRQELIEVTGKGNTVPVDLSKSYNTVGISQDEIGKTGGFDGHGSTLPAEMLPPDVTSMVDSSTLLEGRAALPLYPSGYYTAQTGSGPASNHAVSFLYPAVKAGLPNVVACSGQTISVPGGKYQAVHLLAAAGSDAPVATSLSAQYGNEAVTLPVTVSDWNTAPTTPAFTASYRNTPAGTKPSPVTLGDYRLVLDPTKKLTGVVLPNERSVKILAITLEK